MKLNLTKTTMMLMILGTTILTISSNNLLMTWMAMEINMISFMPLMTKNNKMKDQTMKYFIIQSMASSMIIMSVFHNSMIETPISLSIMLSTSMLIKVGLVPFHMWVPMIMSSLSWETCILLSTIQKIIPIMLISQITSIKLMMWPMVLSMIIAPINAIKQLSTKKIMAFSSITNSPWMIMSTMNSKMQFSLFFIIYSTITTMMMKKMENMKLMFINQMKTLNNMKKKSLMILCLSMSGMPPMTGFLPKWLILQSTLNFSLLMTTVMVCSSMTMTFVYMKMFSNTMLSMTTNKKVKKEMKKKELSIIFNTIGLPMMLLIKSI